MLEGHPVLDGIVQLDFWQVNQHAGDLGSSMVANDLFHMLVDGVADDLLLELTVAALELGRHEHVLDFAMVLTSVILVSVLRSLGGVDRGSSHGLVHHLLLVVTLVHHRRRSVLSTHAMGSHRVVAVLMIGSLVAASVIVVPRLLLLPHHLLVQPSVHHWASRTLAVLGVGASLLASLVELEGRLQKHGEQINQVL